MLRLQDCIYPANFVKMRCVENHDNLRIMKLAPSHAAALAWTAFAAFNRGAFLIYGGQEAGAIHTPSLFDIDKVEWGNYELQPFLTKLAQLKKFPALLEGGFVTLASEPAIQAAWEHPTAGLYGVFNVRGEQGQAAVQLADGTYPDVLNGGTVVVQGRQGESAGDGLYFAGGHAARFEAAALRVDGLPYSCRIRRNCELGFADGKT